MVCCFECGSEYQSRFRKGKLQAYDPDRHAWKYECPNCGNPSFEEDDYYEDDDDDFYEDRY